jgi:hypothetical protein
MVNIFYYICIICKTVQTIITLTPYPDGTVVLVVIV